MGQRLVLTIKYDEEEATESTDICNCYQHWSAYTGCSIDEAQDLIASLQEFMEDNPKFKQDLHDGNITGIRDFCIQAMMESQRGSMPVLRDAEEDGEEDTGFDAVHRDIISKGMFGTARMMEKVRKQAEDAGVVVIGCSKNDGLIAYTQDEINAQQSWSEGNVDIYLDKNGKIGVYFGVCWEDTYVGKYEYERGTEVDKTDKEFEEEFENSYLHVDKETMEKFVDNSDWDLERLNEFDRLYREAYEAGKYAFGNKECNNGEGMIISGIE